MDQDECNLLIDYVRSLPVPIATEPADDKESPRRSRPARQPSSPSAAPTATCRNWGEVDGIYSDLLLHDMGPQLGDSDTYTVFAGEPPRADRPRPAARTRPGTGTTSAREWRTPPLWGLRDSGPYLHDGRAAGIAQAITMHAGQGATSARRFAELPPGVKNNSRRSSCRSLHRHRSMTDPMIDSIEPARSQPPNRVT